MLLILYNGNFNVKVASEVLFSLLLQNFIQLDSNSIDSPIDVLLGVVDVRRESHSVAFLSRHANAVVFVQLIIQHLAQQWLFCLLAFTLAFATFSGRFVFILELDHDDSMIPAQLFRSLNLEYFLAKGLEHFVQAFSQSCSKRFDPLSNSIEADKAQHISSVQHTDQIGIVTLSNHLKPGSVQWNGFIWKGGRWCHLAIVPDVFRGEIWDTLSLHVQDTRLFGA